MNVPLVDFYSVLGITRAASAEDVRRAYKQKVLETHPDKLSPDATEEEKAEARERFSEVHEAFETLGDADQRRAYDIHYRDLPNPGTKLSSSASFRSTSSSRTAKPPYTSDIARSASTRTTSTTGSVHTARTSGATRSSSTARTSDWKGISEDHKRRLREREEWARKIEEESDDRIMTMRASSRQVQVQPRPVLAEVISQDSRVVVQDTRVATPDKRLATQDTTVATQEKLDPAEEYAALVEAMLQELYRLSPEWVERKERLQQLKAARANADNLRVRATSS